MSSLLFTLLFINFHPQQFEAIYSKSFELKAYELINVSMCDVEKCHTRKHEKISKQYNSKWEWNGKMYDEE